VVKPSVPDPSARSPLEGLGIPEDLVGELRRQGISELYPPQAQAIPRIMEGANVLLACPTASGKSLVAYLALLRAARAGRTGLYLVPLRALGQEKAEELQAFSALGVKVGLSVGDFDLPAEKLERLDILVATSEKADGLLRRGSPWLDRLGCVVADEVHLLRDPERGPTLEVSLTRLRRRAEALQIVGSSPTGWGPSSSRANSGRCPSSGACTPTGASCSPTSRPGRCPGGRRRSRVSCAPSCRRAARRSSS